MNMNIDYAVTNKRLEEIDAEIKQLEQEL
jgi:hypothetical protein